MNQPKDSVSISTDKLDIVSMTEVSDLELLVSSRVCENDHTELGDEVCCHRFCSAGSTDVLVQFDESG